MAYSDGTQHDFTTARKAVTQVSANHGVTWGSQVTIRDTADDNAAFGAGQDPAGNILVWVRDRAGVSTYDHVLMKSTDDGATWTLLSHPTWSPAPVIIGPIVTIPAVGLLSFWHNDSGEWGTVTSADDGATWTQTTVETGLTTAQTPVEIRGAYLGSGKILAIGRTQVDGDPLFQLTSSDYGVTWAKSATNITDQSLTPAALDYRAGVVTAYYYHRGVGTLRVRRVAVDTIWAAPTAWPTAATISFGSQTSADAGYPHAVRAADGRLKVVYYSGDSTNAGIYLADILVESPF